MTPLLAVPLIVLLPFGGFAAVHALDDGDTQDVTAQVGFSTESWYSMGGGICVTAGVCVPNLATSLYPANTLHVAVTNGQESARTYLTPKIPAGATVTGGNLKIALDTLTPGAGTTAADLSNLEACTTTATVPQVSGSTDTPPTADCSAASAATRIGTPTDELDLDMTPLAAQLSQHGVSIVLMAADATGVHTWSIATSADGRATGTTVPAPPSLVLQYTTGAAAQPEPSQAPLTPGNTGVTPTKSSGKGGSVTTPSQPGGGTTTGTGTGTGTGSGTTAPPATGTGDSGSLPGATTPDTSSPSSAAAPQLASGSGSGSDAGSGSGSGGVGSVTLSGNPALSSTSLAGDTSSAPRIYDYPEIFLLPLLLAGGIAAFGRQLTQPLSAKKRRR